MSDFIEKARQARAFMQVAGQYIPDEKAFAMPSFFDLWRTKTDYEAGDKRRYADELYRCLQNHTSQAGWEPSAAAALWVEIAAPGEYREIKTDMLSTEAFALNEIGWWQTKTALYKSLIAANIYTPASYPAGWEAL